MNAVSYEQLNIADLLIHSAYMENIGRFEELRADIGDELFDSLSDEDKQFIIETEGIINIGCAMAEKDFAEIERYLREDYDN